MVPLWSIQLLHQTSVGLVSWDGGYSGRWPDGCLQGWKRFDSYELDRFPASLRKWDRSMRKWGTRSEPGRAAVQALGGLVVENGVRPKTSSSPQLRGFASTRTTPQAELGRFCKVLRHFDGLDWTSKNIWDLPKESRQSRSKAATCLSLQSCLIMNIFTKRTKISVEQK